MGFVISFFVISYIFIMCYMFYRHLEHDSIVCALISFFMLVFLFGAIIQGSIKENERGPCVKYETQMHFNAATKTTMPARVCVLRGEWVDEGYK